MIQAVLFDLDGTLVQSDRFVLPAYRQAFADFGLPETPDEVLIQSIGGTYDENHQRTMPGRSCEEYDAYAARVYELVQTRFFSEVCAYPGIQQALARLREKGYVTALCTNASAFYYLPILQQAGLANSFDHLIEHEKGQDKVALAKMILQRLHAERAVMVGDRCYDAEAARASGMGFIGCRYGLFPAEIDAAKPEAVLDRPDELVAAVERVMPQVRLSYE